MECWGHAVDTSLVRRYSYCSITAAYCESTWDDDMYTMNLWRSVRHTMMAADSGSHRLLFRWDPTAAAQSHLLHLVTTNPLLDRMLGRCGVDGIIVATRGPHLSTPTPIAPSFHSHSPHHHSRGDSSMGQVGASLPWHKAWMCTSEFVSDEFCLRD